MSGVRIEPLEAGAYLLVGELGFATVPQVWRDSQPLFEDGVPLRLDLAGVTRADSAALALVLAWLRLARLRRLDLRLRHAPAQLLAVARVSGVEGLLPLEDTPQTGGYAPPPPATGEPEAGRSAIARPRRPGRRWR